MRTQHVVLASVATVLFAEPATAQVKILHSFTGNGGDGAFPYANVTVDRNGNLFGTTGIGGDKNCSLNVGQGCGTVFETTAPAAGTHKWTTSTIYSFTDGTDLAFPASPLTLDQHGVLYGTIAYGYGAYGNVFRLAPPAMQGGAWTFQTLYTFSGQTDGEMAPGTNVLVENGEVYGVTPNGGTSTACTGGCGTLFRLLPPQAGGTAWRYQRLVSFRGGSRGSVPVWLAGPNAAGGGFVGTLGGPGAVVAVAPPTTGHRWSDSIIYRFTGGHNCPPTNFVLGSGGVLFGTRACSTNGVFELTPPAAAGDPWTETTLHQFHGFINTPDSLAPGPNGSLAGASFGEVDSNFGTIWTLTPGAAGTPWTYRDIPQNELPSSGPEGVVFGLKGKLYGVLNGEDNDTGDVFEATPP